MHFWVIYLSKKEDRDFSVFYLESKRLFFYGKIIILIYIHKVGGISDMKIVFFDGVCVLCDHFIQFLLKHDKKRQLYFSPIQGKTIYKTIAASFMGENTVVFFDGEKAYIYSTAALKSIAALGGVWKIVQVLLLIPKWIRDPIYRYIAKHRYKWFGKKEQCFIQSHDLQSRFLE